MGTLKFLITVVAVIYVVCPLVQADRRVGRRSLQDLINRRQTHTHSSNGDMSGGVDGGVDVRARSGIYLPYRHHCDNIDCHFGQCIPNQYSYTCDCLLGYIGTHCNHYITQAPFINNLYQETSTETTTTPVPTTRPTTTTVVCDKLATVSQISDQVPASNTLAAACASGSRASPEAFTLNTCPLAMPGFWKQGDNVLKTCSSLPLYTPIAEFGAFGYVSSPSRLSGVFLGCEGRPEGFKIAVQNCDSFPQVVHVDVGGSNDPHSFYVIKY